MYLKYTKHLAYWGINGKSEKEKKKLDKEK